jgi:hypothetical protein
MDRCLTTRLVARVAALALSGLVASRGGAGEYEVALDGGQRELVVETAGPPVEPVLYLVGLPDRASNPVRKTRGFALNGVRLCETLLSESVLIFYPDGLARWGYYPGFDIFREPQFQNGQRIDPRTLVEYDKWKYDPVEPIRCVGGDMNLLLLHSGGSAVPAFYEIAFPDPVGIRWLEVRSNCDQLGAEGVRLLVRLYGDRARSQRIAERSVGRAGDTPRFPVRFENLDRPRVYLELSAEAPRGASVGMYYTTFEAQLDARRLALPTLATGKNHWTWTDDPDSSHRGRLVVRWIDRPSAERVWEDFEGPLTWSGCEKMASSRDHGLAFTGRHFARATFPADGRDFALNRSLDQVDLSRFNRLGIALRAEKGTAMQAILLGIKNADTGYQYVRLNPQAQWTFQTFDISRFRRDRVAAMNVYWSATPGLQQPAQPCVYDVDTFALWHESAPPPAEPSLPEKIASYRSPFSAAKPAVRPIPPVQEWFPLGVYDGVASRSDRECEWLFDHLRRLSMNTVYISNGSLEGLQRILPLAEARGIRLIHQGGGDGSLYYLHLATPELRRRSLEEVLLPTARQWLPRFQKRWGLLAWSLTEEIGPDLSGELKPYYQLVRQLDAEHPPTVLHNNLEAAKADLQQNRPAVITHDFYPFFWSPQSGPSNPQRSIAAYRSHVAAYYRVCREHGASLWMMPQAWGEAETAPLDPPHYGYRTGMRTPEPGEIRLQGWLAIAEGATGLMFYATVARRPGEHQLWDAGWTETATTRAAGDLCAQVRRVAPLLCRLERDYREAGFVETDNRQVLAHRFVKRPGYGGGACYVVLASLDGFGPQKYSLTVKSDDHVFDVVSRQDVTDRLKNRELGAGEGTLLAIGSNDQVAADYRLIDEELALPHPTK